MFITIHLLIIWFIEYYHYFNDSIHLLFNKKTTNLIREESIKKEQEENYNIYKMKKEWKIKFQDCVKDISVLSLNTLKK